MIQRRARAVRRSSQPAFRTSLVSKKEGHRIASCATSPQCPHPTQLSTTVATGSFFSGSGTFKADNARTGLYVPRQPTDVGDDMLPRRTVLHSNVPNPFNPVTRIRFEIAGSTQATRLQIYDIQGRLVRTLVNAPLDPGWHERFWHGRDDRGRDAASGVYFYRLTTFDGAQIKLKK